MNKPEDIPAAHTRRDSDLPRDRRCLRCGNTFPSAWSGERICRQCKSTTGWRNGLPHVGGSGGRR